MTVFVNELGPRDAPSVVLLHGLSTSGWMWREQAAALVGDLHVLIPDLPGHGLSNDHPWISLSDTVRVVADVIASRTPSGRAHVVGLSLGGYVAALLAADAPEVVDSAIVSGVNVLPFPNPAVMRLAGRVMGPFATSGPVLRANARTLRVRDEDFQAYRASAKAMAKGTIGRVTGDVMAFRVPAAAGTSPCRLLAVAGGDENELILRSLPRLAAGFAAGSARIASGMGHAWNGEEPGLFTAMIRAHVADSPLPEGLSAVE
ncbi:alpha/beta fold hydrolase [Umezawaea tangerina]|uniref:Alpha/beta hydrolase family protein n=1 Tax=Umezawaea tangerina TaxID=84725 RepID=A0A2T0SBW8_9PSEU|nr:alpha/beta hydrolase [Umezawaea tangerina]PRY30917.1 alpha/beta hydrolase family protein [Umezawaea tangerina]